MHARLPAFLRACTQHACVSKSDTHAIIHSVCLLALCMHVWTHRTYVTMYVCMSACMHVCAYGVCAHPDALASRWSGHCHRLRVQVVEREKKRRREGQASGKAVSLDDERSRRYGSVGGESATGEVSPEEYEAYRLGRARADDPMAKFA